MGVPGNPLVTLRDGPQLDAFSRLRTSHPVTLFDSQAQYGNSALYWETATSGTGAIANLLSESAVTLATGGTLAGAFATRQSRVYWRYQPGKSQFIIAAFVFAPGQTNVQQEIGYYDAGNGIFLRLEGTTLNLVRRTSTSGSPADEIVPSSAWNVDKMDGSGPSRIVLDPTKGQILVIDLQWLSLGRVRIGFDIGGVLHYVHEFRAANILTVPYMTTANLPVRARVLNNGVAGGAVTMKMICCSVISEGGFDGNRGPQWSANRGAAAVNVTTRVPFLSLRAKTTGPNGVRNTGQMLPKSWEVCASGNAVMWELLLNPVLTGPAFAAFDAANSIAEVDVTASAIASGGLVLASGFVAASAPSRGSAESTLFRELPVVYTGLGSVQDILTLALTSVTGTAACNASITWQEQW